MLQLPFLARGLVIFSADKSGSSGGQSSSDKPTQLGNSHSVLKFWHSRAKFIEKYRKNTQI